MKKTLGIDIGIASVGWGIIDENNNIIDYGVRLFEELNVDNNTNRRALRGNRRVWRRRKQRIIDLKNILVKNKIIDEKFVAFKNPYKLRQKGIIEKLSNEELATVLLSYAKRRGSSLETVDEETNKEGSTKAILSRNKEQLENKQYIIHTQLDRLKTVGKIRGSENVYKTDDYIKELKVVLRNSLINKELKKTILKLISRRRHFSEGPGSFKSPSPYGRYREVEGEDKANIQKIINKNYKSVFNKKDFEIIYKDKIYVVFKNGKIVNKVKYDLIALMRGKCSLYPEELRAPKQSFSAELFNLLNDLNNLSILNRNNMKLTIEEKNKIIEVIRAKGKITIKQLLKLLNLEEVFVKGFRLNPNEKPIITEFKGYQAILKICKDLEINILSDLEIDKIMEILTETIIEEERINKLQKIIGDNKLVLRLSQLTGISGYHNLSLKAIYQLNEEMINSSLNQQQIITNLNLDKNKKNNKLIANDDAILSPTAKRAHREAIKVVSELIKEHGNFDKIIVETTRNKNSAEERKRIRDSQRYFKNLKDEAREALEGYGEEVLNARNILKFRLYKEQNGKCAYSGLPLDIALLVRDQRAYEIDHIIPYSISFDDSHNNKVLVLPKINQAKGNQTPFGYFASGKADKTVPVNSWEKFEQHVINSNYSRVKKQNLLFLEDINKYEVLEEFINRNIVDTSYAIRTFMMTLKDYFNDNNIDTKVLTIKGKQTNLFRKIGVNIWYRQNPNSNLTNPLIKNRDNYMHHAIDALIIAGLSNQRTLRKLYNLENDDKNIIYDKYTGEVISHRLIDPTEDSEISKYLKKIAYIKNEDVKYSWKIDTKPNRRVSDQTIYSTRLVDDRHVTVKKHTNIYDLDKQKLYDFIYGKNKGNLLIEKHDPKTFEILKKAYDQYAHELKPLKSFYDNHGYLKKYSRKDNGPIIRQLKYTEDALGNHIDITPSDAKNKKVVLLQISPYRADIYYSKKYQSYKFITVRYKDVYKYDKFYQIDEKWYEKEKDRKKINDTYNFMFSIYRNNIIEIIRRVKYKTVKELYRFIAVNNDLVNKIEVKPIDSYDRKQKILTIGKSIQKMNKYNVSATGKTSKVISEDLKFIM